jgi:hypothetical protein
MILLRITVQKNFIWIFESILEQKIFLVYNFSIELSNIKIIIIFPLLMNAAQKL